MQIEIKKSLLLKGIKKIGIVSSNDIKSEFELGSRLVLRAEKKQFSILGTNGHIDASYTPSITSKDDVNVIEDGEAIVDTKTAIRIISALGTNDSVISLNKKDDVLELKDLNQKKKRVVKFQTLSEKANIEFKSINGFSSSFNSSLLANSISSVSKYRAVLDYKLRYLMLCVHFLPDYTRFVCGDGARFGIIEQTLHNKVGEQGEKFVIPATQANIIASVISDSDNNTTLTFSKDKKKLFVDSSDIQMLLKNIPDEEYISYETHAFRQDEATAIVDVTKKEISEVLNITGSVNNKQLEQEGSFHSCYFMADSSGVFKLSVPDGKYTAEAECECSYFNIKDKPEFKSHYSWSFLSDVCKETTDIVRFYCISEQGLLIAEPISVDSASLDDKGVPSKRNIDGSRFIVFFAAVNDK